MGGDGGVVATSRRYLRGAGTADHTADCKRTSSTEIAQAEKERLQQMMKTCAITGSSLLLNNNNNNKNIVACPYGRLYDKEAAIKALLKRKKSNTEEQGSAAAAVVDIGWHVRGLKDLYPVQFYLDNNNNDNDKASCPISAMELNGAHSAFLMIYNNNQQQKKDQPNVLSEKAIKEMGMNALQEEYGPFERLLRLAPTIANGDFDQICQEWVEVREQDEKKSNKKKKKRNKKNNTQESSSSKRSKIKHHTGNQTKLTSTARSNVAAAVNSNSVFSSIFKSKKAPVSDKEKKDNLFVR
uniref:Replication termination factor 2 n=1 Tax=Eucampia antarctica TaxID=49252 RepID=A0A7S2VYK3_9STRA|mmetsp:Transcript_10513/g.10078  ORF Transcript_10513/g.10078 Transcript_10513/m.10078 type:complete len:297 (+) Transcript_10513:94-984(+)